MRDPQRIKILPDSVASAIAAGEVIERPASVVKELIENALDARAKRISIAIEDAGMRLIEVSDDGDGIASDDLNLAVERYATSKLRTAEDLFDVQTLGFRGEALSSIGAVSRMSVLSQALEAEIGSSIVVEAGTILDRHSLGASHGTTVAVRDLFYNVPARKKFVKSAVTERRRINVLTQRYAMAYPHVGFRVSHDGKLSLETPGNGDEREILARVFNTEIARGFIALPSSPAGGLQIRGFISPPNVNRSNRQELTFFVNGRWVQDAGLSAAVVQAYHTLLMVGRYPLCVIFIGIPASQIDVNVHPTKAEIRFQDHQKVFHTLQRAVRATLLGQAVSPHVDFRDSWRRETGSGGTPAQDWVFAGDDHPEQAVLPLGAMQPGSDSVPLLRSVGQIGLAYLVAEGPDGVYLIDQHAAHERVLYERYLHELESGELESQALLSPILLELTKDQAGVLRDNVEQLSALGFGLEEFGEQTYRLRSVPSLFVGKDPHEAIRAVVDDFEEDEAPLALKREARLIARICKRLAIKTGQLLALEEQRELIRALEACAAPRTCPHGRPTMIHLPVSMLARQFGRT